MGKETALNCTAIDALLGKQYIQTRMHYFALATHLYNICLLQTAVE